MDRCLSAPAPATAKAATLYPLDRTAFPVWESIRISGVLCSGGLGDLRRIVVCEVGIPFLEEGPECAVECARSDLQQQVRAALRPLHLLAFGEALADDSVHRGFREA
jgi:hypothetical protein